jgi:hypothetical protein
MARPISGVAVMTEYQLSLGAHLLLWVFPLSLVATALLLHLRSRARRESRS